MKLWQMIIIAILVIMTIIGCMSEKSEKDPFKKKIIIYRKKVMTIIIVSALLLTISSGTVVISWAYKMDEDTSLIESYINDKNIVLYEKEEKIDNVVIKKENIKINFDYLKATNDDTVGWIIMDDTDINYPVVHTTNNKFYLDHSYTKGSNYNGWVFADYRNILKEDKNLIIYAHNRINGTMFGTLGKALNKNWVLSKKEHIITFIDENSIYKYQIFSAYVGNVESFYIQTDFEHQDFNQFLNTLSKRSKYDFGVLLNENDRIVTLSTCSNDNTGRIVVHAKLISITAN